MLCGFEPFTLSVSGHAISVQARFGAARGISAIPMRLPRSA